MVDFQPGHHCPWLRNTLPPNPTRALIEKTAGIISWSDEGVRNEFAAPRALNQTASGNPRGGCVLGARSEAAHSPSQPALGVSNASRYYALEILSFACAETEGVFRAEISRHLPPDLQRTARRKLLTLHAATELRRLTVPPGNRLEALEGGRKGGHSIRVNDQWRICFRWVDGHAQDVEIVDYHRA